LSNWRPFDFARRADPPPEHLAEGRWLLLGCPAVAQQAGDAKKTSGNLVFLGDVADDAEGLMARGG
jgi:hypothetical protein